VLIFRVDLYINIDIIIMEFEIFFYKDEDDISPIEEFLEKLRRTNLVLWKQTSRGIEKLRVKAYHTEPLSKYLEPGLWELRIKARTDILRIVYTFQKGKIVILLHIFIKKQQKMPGRELKEARKRLKEIKLEEVN